MADKVRRKLLLGAGAVAGYSAWRLWPEGRGDITFVAHATVPGFRTLVHDGAALSRGNASQALLLGLTERPALPDAIVAEVTADPGAFLFAGTGAAPAMAYFTDIRCPICRPYEAELAALRDENPGLPLVTHELPIFGESSTLAARALIAAGPELAERLRPRLQRTPVVMSEDYLGRVIADAGGDAERVQDDLFSAATDLQLHRSRALANLFGFAGTPALVLGRTALLGAHPLRRLRAVLAAERTV